MLSALDPILSSAFSYSRVRQAPTVTGRNIRLATKRQQPPQALQYGFVSRMLLLMFDFAAQMPVAHLAAAGSVVECELQRGDLVGSNLSGVEARLVVGD
eukprot:3941684-Rhodomonas_salina.3